MGAHGERTTTASTGQFDDAPEEPSVVCRQDSPTLKQSTTGANDFNSTQHSMLFSTTVPTGNSATAKALTSANRGIQVTRESALDSLCTGLLVGLRNYDHDDYTRGQKCDIPAAIPPHHSTSTSSLSSASSSAASAPLLLAPTCPSERQLTSPYVDGITNRPQTPLTEQVQHLRFSATDKKGESAPRCQNQTQARAQAQFQAQFQAHAQAQAQAHAHAQPASELASASASASASRRSDDFSSPEKELQKEENFDLEPRQELTIPSRQERSIQPRTDNKSGTLLKAKPSQIASWEGDASESSHENHIGLRADETFSGYAMPRAASRKNNKATTLSTKVTLSKKRDNEKQDDDEDNDDVHGDSTEDEYEQEGKDVEMKSSSDESDSEVGAIVTSINKNDVLCGRGKGPNNHSGNCRFRELVRKYRNEYLGSRGQQTKKRICNRIMDTIASQSPPGRFLARKGSGAKKKKWREESSTSAEEWCVIDREKARVKTSQALREGITRDMLSRGETGSDTSSQSSSPSASSRTDSPSKSSEMARQRAVELEMNFMAAASTGVFHFPAHSSPATPAAAAVAAAAAYAALAGFTRPQQEQKTSLSFSKTNSEPSGGPTASLNPLLSVGADERRIMMTPLNQQRMFMITPPSPPFVLGGGLVPSFMPALAAFPTTPQLLSVPQSSTSASNDEWRKQEQEGEESRPTLPKAQTPRTLKRRSSELYVGDAVFRNMSIGTLTNDKHDEGSRKNKTTNPHVLASSPKDERNKSLKRRVLNRMHTATDNDHSSVW